MTRKWTLATLLLGMAFASPSVFAACPTSTAPPANLTNRVARRVSQLTQLFPSLNESALTTYFTSVADNQAAAAPTLCADRQALEQAVQGNAGQAAITAAATALATAQGSLLASNGFAESQLLATVSGLNPTQLAQLQRLLGGGGGFGRGGFGFPGGMGGLGGFHGAPPANPAAQ